MKIVLYILLALGILILGFFTWFFLFFNKIPDLNIPENVSEEEKIVLIDDWLEELNTKNKFNGAILIAKEGKTLLAKGYGYTNHSKNEKLTANSSFRLASVSKQFTAVGIMLLEERGQIEYDDLVSKHIDDFPYKEVTIRSLLNQVSGVPDKYLTLAEKNKEVIKILSNEKAVDLIVTNTSKKEFEPFEKYQYSNTNYILLARIIEIISGQSFEDFMDKEVFNPLGMKNTRVWNLFSTEKTFENKTNGFENFMGRFKEMKPTFIDGVAGDGGVFSSVNDFLVWDQFWYDNELIDKGNLKKAFGTPKLKSGTLSDYGFGWVIDKDVVWHNGAWLAANTVIIRNTKKKTCLVILDNSSNFFFDKITQQIENTIH
ncbi:serine hydrolase [Aquimarina sp. AU474]|uniref:serine hydrolase domain-containing protein n=1 Tax=Aquimarina sp. AU474 TaxID=2108529 RepID=UPI000D6944E8|nr:serine hydrolase domain-containing protein [Aquimarina sp. AU474]